jgi:predicted peptidase
MFMHMTSLYNKTMLVLLAFACSFPALHAQYPSIHKEYSEAHYKGVRYGLFKPVNYDSKKSYPLVVYLHGSTDTVSRDIHLYQDSIQQKYPCFVLTPKCTNPDQGWGNTWTAAHAPTTAITLELVDELIRQNSIDKNRLYIYGISMGGFGVFSVLQKNPGKFAGAYAICGGSDTTAANKVMLTPLWIFHGDADDIVPVRLSRNIYNKIIELGGKQTKYTEYPGVKHNSWENALREPALLPWLFSQRLQKN